MRLGYLYEVDVSALTTCKLWEIERQVFQAIVMKTELMRQRHYAVLLRRWLRHSRSLLLSTHLYMSISSIDSRYWASVYNTQQTVMASDAPQIPQTAEEMNTSPIILIT